MSDYTPEQISEMARKLDHACMSAMEIENRELKSALLKALSENESLRRRVEDDSVKILEYDRRLDSMFERAESAEKERDELKAELKRWRTASTRLKLRCSRRR